MSENATLYVVLQPYLESLRALERSKRDGLHVPSIDELAQELNVSRSTLFNFARGNIKQLNLTLAGQVIVAMRRRGFPMEITDLLSLRE